MKKFRYLLAALVLSFSLTACTTDIPPEDTSLPNVDVVQRSELLDMVNIDYVLDADTKQLLADCGVSATMSDFALTADDMAQFTLAFATSHGEYSYKFNAIIDYSVSTDGTFGDIRLYWGSITAADDNLLITSLYDYALLPLDAKPQNFVPHYLSFIKDKGGYIVYATQGFGKYGFIYRTPEEEGIAVFDSADKMLAHYTAPLHRVDTWGTFGAETAQLVSDTPFSYVNQFKGEFVSQNLFMIDFSDQTVPTYRLYDITANTMTDTAHRNVESITVDETTYTVYEIYVPDGGDINVGYQGLALRQKAGQYTGAVLYDTKGFNYIKQSGGSLYLDHNGNLVYHSKPTGLRFTIDFEKNTFTKDYLITEEMLGEKLATSRDKAYSIYEYGRYLNKNWYVSWRAVKNEKTGEIRYLDGYYAKNDTGISLEAGFFSNGEIYLMYDFDFEIFDPANPEKGPVFSIGEKYPLGIKDDEGYPINTLWAVRRDPVDKTFIVVNDHMGPHRWYLTDEMFDGIYFKDTFDVSLLDKDGNITKTFTTGMKVPSDTNILNISISGDIITMTNSSRETGEVIQQGKLNIKNGKFTVIKQ